MLLLHCVSLEVARSVSAVLSELRLLSGVNRTQPIALITAGFDPKPTWTSDFCCNARQLPMDVRRCGRWRKSLVHLSHLNAIQRFGPYYNLVTKTPPFGGGTGRVPSNKLS